MIASIENFLNGLIGNQTVEQLDERELNVACAALLVHCAKVDGEQCRIEDKKIREILSNSFDLSGSDVDAVIETATAQQENAVDLHRFTRVIHKSMDREGRLRVVRLLWEMANADGTIGPEERNLVSVMAQLLDVEGHDAVALRQDVLAQSKLRKANE
ncbi:conserved protein of unknown function [Candidatus Filomicrobium marinum]|uniref:Co-chaperone DjlA N-terminal domain-containing protein n=3 Tax=Filomicrobium TaxID=119044 RepID=A0A0D6JD87_9HYPH|nr:MULTISPECIES: TerB family tellurite resistance protein [Filomicrobium]MCV0368283.1 TerB family tellurite resistance protein [Filomicrobium sp.]CFX12961.1 conserved protein of unknown function [Candidatus Filomicrobium marinum]CPR17532.1 conserved protein of unknown function [Candidatus Filomicrobium marinum]SDO32426.1 Uncharacterized conserved protein, tellurite resistance protein B (TerB) family [Filomicrobium insigne]